MICQSFKNISKENKYAIHAYTHGPVTGSGPSVVLVLSLVVASPWPGELAKGPRPFLPPPPSSLPYSANVNLTAAYRRWP